MKVLFIFLASLSCSLSTRAVVLKPKEKKVLFIGNSLTSFHDMPQTLQKMVDEGNLNIKIDQLTFNGSRLSLFATNIEYEKNTFRTVEKGETPIGVTKITSQKWDYVVLQEGGSAALVPCFQRYSFEPSVLFLDSVIKSTHAKMVLYQDYPAYKFPFQVKQDRVVLAQFEFYNNSAHKINPLISCQSAIFENSHDQLMEIEKIYNGIAKKTNSAMVKVGYAFEAFKKKKTHIDLIESDGGHPTKQGSYLIACLFYKFITSKPLDNIKYSADLDPRQAVIIRTFADTMR